MPDPQQRRRQGWVTRLPRRCPPTSPSRPPVLPLAPRSDFGGRRAFHGPAATVRCHESNVLVRQALEGAGHGRVLVVDGGASLRCALLGGSLGGLALANGWAGILVLGCVRDTAELAALDLGIKALAACPVKSSKRDPGLKAVSVCECGWVGGWGGGRA